MFHERTKHIDFKLHFIQDATGIASIDVKKLKDVGFCMVESVAYSPRKDLLQIKGITNKLVPLGFTIASQLQIGSITEIYGEFCSKTQLFHTLCVTFQLILINPTHTCAMYSFYQLLQVWIEWFVLMVVDSATFGIVVIIMNQVVTQVDGSAIFVGPQIKPIGGNIMAYASTTRFEGQICMISETVIPYSSSSASYSVRINR
ncbi:hypothetical protein UlMin_027543 [Ulmus minor]